MFMNVDWESVINQRRSTRSFDKTPVEQEKLELLQKFYENIEVPFEHNVQIRLFKADVNKKLYMVFDSPPDGAAFIANTDVCSVAAAGFVGEFFVLYAARLGISTCWYGHYLTSELERIMPHLDIHNEMPKWGYGKDQVEGQRAICITPLGYWKKDGVRLFDRITENFISYKRKPVMDIIENGPKEEDIPSEILFALDLARKAPSAANSQHWRFNVSSDSKVINISMPLDYKHIKWEHPNVDVGICACHFWLGLVMKDIACKISLNENQGCAVWKFEF